MKLPTSASVPLNPDEQCELSLADKRVAKIRNAASIALVNGWLTALFAALSALLFVRTF